MLARGRAAKRAIVVSMVAVLVGIGVRTIRIVQSDGDHRGRGPPATTGAAASGVGDFGTLKAVCGPGDAKGATDPGVTDTSINMATMSDPGLHRPCPA